jgi:two-component system nitrogen regulation response regulator GlnG
VRFFEEELASAMPERSVQSVAEAGWIPAALIAELCEHDWPGNVRQLRNVAGHLVITSLSRARLTISPTVERLLGSAPGADPAPGGILTAEPPTDGEVSADALPPPPPALSEPRARRVGAPGPAGGSKRAPVGLSEAEIRHALRECRWEIDAAAKHLGVTRPSLYRAMERFPAIRTARDLKVDEIGAAHRAAGGDVARMADALEVSEKALSRRVRDLGLSDAHQGSLVRGAARGRSPPSSPGE